MNFGDLANQAKKFLVDNAPTILTGAAAVGVVGTAYLTGRATFKAAEVLKKAEYFSEAENGRPLTSKEKAQLCWRLYLPAAAMGALTISALISSNRIGNNRAAGLAAAASLSARAFEQYKDKVKEKFGENKSREVRDELAQDQVNTNPPSQQFVMMGTPGKVLCLDAWTKRYFWSTMETIKKAQNDIDYKALHDDYPSLTDFYQRIGLEPTAASDNLGWTSDNRPEVLFSATLAEPHEGQGTIPVMVITYVNEPMPNHWKPSSGY
jgi:hypothetical protein